MKPSILIFLVLITLAQPMLAHDEYTKIVRKEFNVNPDAQLVIDNKFGSIHCNNWDKNVISIEVKITVDAVSESAAGKAMEKVEIATTGTPSQVTAITRIGEGGFSGKTKVTVDYTINLPVSAGIDFTNKFGDIFINEVTGKAKITLSYGNMEANKLDNSDNLLDFRFSDATIRSIKGAVVSLKYSDLDIDYAGSIRLDSKYSDLNADRIISLNGNFEGGKLTMENNSALDSKSRFSDLNITRIEKTLSLDIQYGNCDVAEMPSDFTSVNVRNKYANVSIGISENASYKLEASMKFCEIDFPEGKSNVSQRIITNTSKTYHATVGSNSASTSRVNVVSEFGNVDLE